ncbi:hypothetical protein HYALB_00010374 [Hymenoscyphus albidus]|uniref:PXA domain-containing protein n=1 Tax=Hymenoscyphus albidus TaxID=595503 RepID=A0A9N9LMX5_9HELO|nr:hypothetical protein HYALB_00010374 [Hymenoscyphus albidus]
MSRLQPRSKAISTSNLSSQSASANPTTSNVALAPTPDQPLFSAPEKIASGTSTRNLASDPASDRSTIFLIRRTLCSHLGDKGRSTPAPIDEILPPLTSSNEVDLQLYAFIAIIIREFVHTWYAKITPDPVFVEEVVKIIAHCTRALEQRLRKVDMESLLLDELPELLDVHLQAYRAANTSINPPPIQTNSREIYHALWPMPALSPVPDQENGPLSQQQRNNETLYRQMLVQGVLAVLLPTEDLDNDCLTTLVGQIFSEMILGNGVGGKASEPWLLWEGIMKIAEVIKAQISTPKVSEPVLKSPDSVNASESSKRGNILGFPIQKTFWMVLQYAFVGFTALRVLITTLATASALPSRLATNKPNGSPNDSSESQPTFSSGIVPNKRPIMKMKIWSTASHLLDLDFRMPWLSAMISMLQWSSIAGPGGLGNTDQIFDKILSHQIHTHILDSTRLPTLLLTLRTALFPNNTLAPPRTIPSPAEALLLRRKCALALLALVPLKVQTLYLGTSDEEQKIADVEEVLDVFSDSYCNKHLLYSVVELVVVRLMPEMGEKGVEELLEERLS